MDTSLEVGWSWNSIRFWTERSSSHRQSTSVLYVSSYVQSRLFPEVEYTAGTGDPNEVQRDWYSPNHFMRVLSQTGCMCSRWGAISLSLPHDLQPPFAENSILCRWYLRFLCPVMISTSNLASCLLLLSTKANLTIFTNFITNSFAK